MFTIKGFQFKHDDHCIGLSTKNLKNNEVTVTDLIIHRKNMNIIIFELLYLTMFMTLMIKSMISLFGKQFVKLQRFCSVLVFVDIKLLLT